VVEPLVGAQNVRPDVPPPALRVSVLDIARDVVAAAETRATVLAVLTLSAERQDLLRRLLADAEVPA
jgi:hypothetical protein